MRLKELRNLLDNKKIGAVELVKEHLNQIEKYDKNLNSFITICADEAIANAKIAQSAIDNGKSKLLTGFPISIKDNIITKDIKTTCASKMLSDFVPPYNATVIQKIIESGAVIIGKTNMDEFAMGSTTQTSYFGNVKNPYNTDYIPGGSSGGSAVSVSADMCVASLGSDTGGSVRQPSSLCGVTGLKPTYGAVSRYGLVAFASSLEQIGIIAKCAEDTAYILDVIYGFDEKDTTTSKSHFGGYTSLIGSDIKPLKIGVPKEIYTHNLDNEVKEAFVKSIEYFKSIGTEIVDVSIPSVEYAVSAYYLISSAEAASNLSRYDGIKYGYRSNEYADYNTLVKKTRNDSFGDEVKRRIMLGNYALSAENYENYYKRAMTVRKQLTSEIEYIFANTDVILTPTIPNTAYKIGEVDIYKIYNDDMYTSLANLTGYPSISTTCGYDKNGLPIGISFMGRKFDEKTIVAVCDDFENTFERRGNDYEIHSGNRA